MGTLAEDLRTARQHGQLTLQQVADLTLVNVKFLEAIDRGDYAFLPQAYVRAFVREYAQVVGIDPARAGLDPAHLWSVHTHGTGHRWRWPGTQWPYLLSELSR